MVGSARPSRTHYFGLLECGAVETFPHALRDATYVWPVSLPAVCGHARRCGPLTSVRWNTIAEQELVPTVSAALDRLPTEKVYVTIDKVVLRVEDCFTNHYRRQQGTMSLDELLAALRGSQTARPCSPIPDSST